MLRLQLGLAGACLACLSTVASAATIRVPEDYPTVLAAVDAAAPGDSVVIGPGTWNEVESRTTLFGIYQTITACAFLKAGMTLIGAGAGLTILDQGGVGPIGWGTALVYPDQSAAGRVRIEGMTISGGGTQSGVLIGPADGLEITNCVVRDCGSDAVGVYRCDLVIEDSMFTANGATYCVDASDCDLEVRRTEFVANESPRSITAGHLATNSVFAAIIENCRFQDTGGTVLFGVRDVEVLRNVFTQTSRPHRMLSVVQSGAFVMRGTIAYNVFDRVAAIDAPLFQGCVRVEDLAGDVTHSTWSQCSSNGGWAVGTFALDEGGSFRNNVIAGSTGAPAVAVVGPPGSSIDVRCNDYWDNAQGDFTEDYPPDAEDFFVDPQFCDPENGDLTLESGSFLAAENNPVCGQIGALGVGCGTVSVRPESWARIKAMYREGDGS